MRFGFVRNDHRQAWVIRTKRTLCEIGKVRLDKFRFIREKG